MGHMDSDDIVWVPMDNNEGIEIIPMHHLAELGCDIRWNPNGLTVRSPDGQPIDLLIRNGLPYLRRSDLKLIRNFDSQKWFRRGCKKLAQSMTNITESTAVSVRNVSSAKSL